MEFLLPVFGRLASSGGRAAVANIDCGFSQASFSWCNIGSWFGKWATTAALRSRSRFRRCLDARRLAGFCFRHTRWVWNQLILVCLDFEDNNLFWTVSQITLLANWTFNKFPPKFLRDIQVKDHLSLLTNGSKSFFNTFHQPLSKRYQHLEEPSVSLLGWYMV